MKKLKTYENFSNNNEINIGDYVYAELPIIFQRNNIAIKQYNFLLNNIGKITDFEKVNGFDNRFLVEYYFPEDVMEEKKNKTLGNKISLGKEDIKFHTHDKDEADMFMMSKKYNIF